MKKIFDHKNFIFILILSILIASESLAQTFLESATKKHDYFYLFLGMSSYAIVGFIYYLFLKDSSSLAIANTIWNAATTVIIALISVIYFKQKISLKQGIGIGIVFVGSLLLG